MLEGFPRRLRVIPVGDIDAGELQQQFPDHSIVGITGDEHTEEPYPSSIAYLLFTSGSTGMPKGVPITHANVTSEALPATAVEAWASSAPNGPTEATIAISHYRWTTEDAAEEFPGGIVPIGDIFPTSQGCIVDEQLNSVAEGVAGELCLAGPQLSAGYWNNPEQTAKAFVRIAGKEGIWWTGDLVRQDESGTLIYLNRLDLQVQIMVIEWNCRK